MQGPAQPVKQASPGVAWRLCLSFGNAQKAQDAQVVHTMMRMFHIHGCCNVHALRDHFDDWVFFATVHFEGLFSMTKTPFCCCLLSMIRIEHHCTKTKLHTRVRRIGLFTITIRNVIAIPVCSLQCPCRRNVLLNCTLHRTHCTRTYKGFSSVTGSNHQTPIERSTVQHNGRCPKCALNSKRFLSAS